MVRSGLSFVFLVSLIGLFACTSPPCGVQTTVIISASATCVKVGEVVTVTVTLSNQGCIPLYQTSRCDLIRTVEGPGYPLIEEEDTPQTFLYRSVEPGASVSDEFVYRAVKPGWEIFTGEAYYFVIMDSDDWYAERVKSVPLTIVVIAPWCSRYCPLCSITEDLGDSLYGNRSGLPVDEMRWWNEDHFPGSPSAGE